MSTTQGEHDAIDSAIFTGALPDPDGYDPKPEPPQMILRIYSETVEIERAGVSPDRRVWHTSPSQVAAALAGAQPLSTGLLPPETLWRTIHPNGVLTAIWVPPSVRTIGLTVEWRQAAPTPMTVPFPGLVFVVGPGAPYVFAAKERPSDPDQQLYRCPSYNVLDRGRICVGSHPFSKDPAEVPVDFFTSYFAAGNTGRRCSRAFPDEIAEQWRALMAAGATSYPLDDLVPECTVAQAMAIRP